MIRKMFAPLALVLAACASGPAEAPATAPDQLLQRVAAYVQETHIARTEVVKTQVTAAGLTPTVEEFAGKRTGGQKGYNVTARVGPANGREILLVAHYDALEKRDGKLVHGVVDNAASSVAMIEAARRLKGRTKHPIRLLLTDQEELGLLGAHAWIAAHGVTNIAAVINADINANGDMLMYGLNNGAQSANMVAAIRALCTERAMKCIDIQNYPPSDDRAFSAAGVPTISLGHQPEAEAVKLKAAMDAAPGSPMPTGAAIPEVFQIIHTDGDVIARVQPATIAAAADVFVALALKLDAELP